MKFPAPRWAALVAALLAVIGGTVLVIDTDGDGPRKAITLTVPSSAVIPAAPAGDLQAQASDRTSTGIEKGEAALRDETPDAIAPETLKAADQAEAKIAAPLPAVDDPLPVGGAQNYRCRQDFSGSGYYGARRPDAKVMSFKLHYTVSPNIVGWGDILGVAAYLKRVGLSAHLIADFEGHCLQIVPFSRNAYTQGAFNSTSESVEIIATGRETRAQWLASPLIKKGILAAIVRDRLRARGLPLRFVDPAGCTDRLGYTDHNHLECSNNHTDVAPTFPFDVFRRQVADGPKPVTVTDRVTCRKLNWWREHRRPGGKAEANAVRRKKALTARGVTCTAAGPVKA